MNTSLLTTLFSVVIKIDRALNITFASPTLLKHLPDLYEKKTITGAFSFLRPNKVDTFDDITASINSLFLLVSHDKKFAIRGQVIAENDGVIFCGAPWLFWINNHQPNLKLGMADFSTQDVQLDQLFLMTTEKQMMEDLEMVNTQLVDTKNALQASQKVQQQFFAQMSHDMRTPLNGIISALTLLRDQSLPPAAQSLIDHADKASANLLQVLNYVLDISRLQAENTKAENASFSLLDLLHNVIDIIKPRCVEKHLALNLQVADTLDTVLHGDAPRLQQILLNLLVNATKYTHTGGITLHASIVQHKDDSVRIRFDIEDTGIGIDPKNIDFIFNPFWRGNSNNLDQQSTGLGLDIVKRYAALLNGSVSVTSTPNVGSVFSVELPFQCEGNAKPQPSSSAPTPDTATTRQQNFTGNILLVDDNETNLQLGQLILESLGLTVTCANGGANAIDLAISQYFDLILMDINMPDIDGIETSKILLHEHRYKQPIIALTAYTETLEKQKCLDAGLKDFLTKPILRDQLAATLSRWLPKHDISTDSKVGNPSAIAKPNSICDVDNGTLNTLIQQVGVAQLAPVINHFKTELAQRTKALTEAANQKDIVTLAREAHTLSSTCRSFGLLRLGAEFSQIENKAKQGIVAPQCSEVPQQCHNAIDNLQRYIDNYNAQ